MMTIEDRATTNPNAWVEQQIQDYLENDGRNTGHPAGDNLVLLYSTGRTSGEIRRVALGAVPYEDSMLLIAAAGGSPKEPQWYKNLVADPTVWIRKQTDLYEATATVLDGADRDAAWNYVTSQIPVVADYERTAGRQIPLVRIDRNN
ncbi:MAG: nitroreductase/quinone reductase family protein [Acidimicrobiia bacterium]